MNAGNEIEKQCEDRRAWPLSGLQLLVGALAGLAATVYLTGGVALALRLWWSGFPGLTVGQLPREFLFSLGVAQVVLPALAVGLVAGVLELGQDTPKLDEGHLPWSTAKFEGPLRSTYIAFYGAMSVAFVGPGTAIAILNDNRVDDPAIAVVVFVVAALAVSVWVGFARRSRIKQRGKPYEGRQGDLIWKDWCWILAPGACLTFGLAVWMQVEKDSWRYFGVIGAWAVALLFTLLTVWLRSRVRGRRRADIEVAKKNGEAEPEVAPLLVIASWCATAVMCVPGFIVVAAAIPLTGAVVCAEQIGKPQDDRPRRGYVAAGRFVGETKERVYIGVANDKSHSLVSVPTSKMSRLLIGADAADPAACDREADPDAG